METGVTAGLMTKLKAFCAVGPLELLSARTVKLNEPAAVGVPVSTPLEDKLSPPGKLPEIRDHVYGGVPPVAANVWE
jgi:hypothetical protein